MVYGIIIVAFCVIVGLVELVRSKSIVNPVTVFCAVWAVVTGLSIIHPIMEGRLSPTSVWAYQMILCGVVAFVLGSYLVNLPVKWYSRHTWEPNSGKKSETQLRYGFVNLLGLLCVAFYLLRTVELLSQLEFFSLQEVQRVLQAGEYESNDSAIMRAIAFLIVEPVSFALPAILAVDIWYGKRNRALAAITVTLLVLRIISTANRTTILLMFVFLLLMGLMHPVFTDGKDPRKARKWYIGMAAMVVIAVILFAAMTASRGHGFLSSTMLAFAIPPRMLQVWTEYILQGEYQTYGLASLLGFVYPVFYFIKNLFGMEGIPAAVQQAYDLVMLTDSQWMVIGPEISANAYVTPFWFLYLDGRYAGIFIGMLLLGGLMAYVFYRALRDRSQRTLCLYCILFYSVLYSFVRVQFAMPRYAIAVVFIALFAYKNEKKPADENAPKMRVLFVENAGSASAGAFHSMIALIQKLRQMGVEAHVALPDRADGVKMLQAQGIPYIRLRGCAYSWMISQNAPDSEKKKMPLKNLFVRFSSVVLAIYCRIHKIDLIHENTSACYMGAYAAKMTGAKHVWHIREFMEEDFNATIWNRPYAHKLMEQSDAVITISKAVYGKYAKLIDTANMRMIYNGLDVDRFLDAEKTVFETEPVKILSVGRISSGKGQRTLLEAAIILKEKYGFTPQILFAGAYREDDPYYCEMNDLIQEKALGEQVRFLGQCGNMKELYRNCDIFCMCSRCEAFGRVTVEAMLAGALAVGADSGGTGEILTHDQTGLLFTPEDPVSLAECLNHALTNRSQMKQIAAAGREHVRVHYDALQNAQQIFSIYQELLD